MTKDKSINKLLSKKKEKSNIKWIIIIIVLSFILSITFSLISEVALSNTSLFISIIILFSIIFIGVLFDIVGVAVTTAEEAPFHSMASRKINSAKTAIYLKKNASKVSSICCDVIGDICGIISGACGVSIAYTIINNTSYNPLIVTLVITGLIASFTIGGKAISKYYAINNSNIILNRFSKIIYIFIKEK